jgi:F-type H+-transporting ATPase subunit b
LRSRSPRELASRASATLALVGVLGWAGSAVAAGDAHEGGHEVNYFYGLLGESDEVSEPSVMYRPTGMPVPLAAQLFNSAVLFGLLYKFGKGPVKEGLRRRREGVVKDLEAAAKMKAEAESQLAEHEARLQRVDSEIDRLKREMREAAQAERTAILAEAKKRRERMERDAQLLITQELKAAREQLFASTVHTAVQGAKQLVESKANAEDHVRLSEEYLSGLRASLAKSGHSASSGGAR